MNRQEELFEQAIKRIRRGTETFLDIVHDMESDCRGAGLDSSVVCSKARSWLEEAQKAAFEAATTAFQRGETFHEVVAKLIKCDFYPYDAEVCASRARAKAEELGPLEEDTEEVPSAGAR